MCTGALCTVILCVFNVYAGAMCAMVLCVCNVSAGVTCERVRVGTNR